MARIAITCGDPSGLGPELIERCLKDSTFAGSTFRVFGSGEWLDGLAASSIASVEPVALSELTFTPGEPNPDGARLAIEAMESAAASCVNGECDAVVTGPISKALCAAQGYEYPGQTEFFAARWGGSPTMAFVGAHLNVCLSTWHIPLSQVPKSLDEAAFKKSIRAAHGLGLRLGYEYPRVIVCGLNPHAGEGGLLGSEEGEFLDPWLEELRSELPQIIGCVPGDTAFARAMKGDADVVVALYHDQGLAAFKTIDFDSGVNITLGLPHLRVSPDHGTGFDIAGKGLASAESMRRAIELSIRLA